MSQFAGSITLGSNEWLNVEFETRVSTVASRVGLGVYSTSTVNSQKSEDVRLYSLQYKILYLKVLCILTDS